MESQPKNQHDIPATYFTKYSCSIFDLHFIEKIIYVILNGTHAYVARLTDLIIS